MTGSHRNQCEEKHHGKQPVEGPLVSPEKLYKQSGGGEVQSIEELLASKEFYPIVNTQLRPIAVAMRLPADRIEDVMQEVCLAILEYLDRHGEDAVQRWRSWLRQVTRYKTVDALRHLYLGTVSLDPLAMEAMAPEGDERDLERRTWVAERLEDTAADESLNARLLRGRFVEDRTNAELAATEGLTKKAVERRICKMIVELRQEATKEGLVVPNQKGNPPGEKWKKAKKF